MTSNYEKYNMKEYHRIYRENNRDKYNNYHKIYWNNYYNNNILEARRQRQTNNSNYDSNISNLIANHRETLNNRQIAQRRRREREVREEEEASERILDIELEALDQEERRINDRRNEILSSRIR